MRHKSILYILAVSTLLPVCLHAETWTLDSCISYATAHNISMRRQELAIRQGELEITEAKDRFLPSVSASASESVNFGRGLTSQNTYANRNTSNTQWSVGVNLPLFQGMSEYKRLKVARLSLDQYILEKEATRENLTLNIISQYMQVLYNKEAAQAARVQLELSEFQVERQKALIEAGKAAEATLYDLEAVAAQDRLQVMTADNDISTSIVNLANLLQLDSTEGFDIAPLDRPDPEIPLPDAVFASAMQSNGNILGARQAVKVADGNVELARTSYIPTLSFNGGIGSSFYTVSGLPHDNFGGQMRQNFSTYLGITLQIPVFDAFGTRNSIRRAKVQRQSAMLDLELRESDLYRDIRLAYTQACGARDRYLTSGETLEKTRLSFESTRERFDLGRATQADYEQAKTNLYNTEIRRIQAKYEYLLRTDILEFYRNPAAR